MAVPMMIVSSSAAIVCFTLAGTYRKLPTGPEIVQYVLGPRPHACGRAKPENGGLESRRWQITILRESPDLIPLEHSIGRRARYEIATSHAVSPNSRVRWPHFRDHSPRGVWLSSVHRPPHKKLADRHRRKD